ncbi:MAG: ornithine cyclodeaminase family protein [Anaerovoracaceae bacterium]
MKIITSKEISNKIQMVELINVASEAYLKLYNGGVSMPVRTVTDFGDDGPLVFYKPTYDIANSQVVIKLLNQLKHTSDFGYPTIQGIVILIDAMKNEISAIMDGRQLTALRTGAASGLAAKLLSREDSKVLAVFGAGAQAYTQINGILSVRAIKKIIIYDISDVAIEKLIDYFSFLKDITFVKGASLVELSEADIICTVTNSTKPLFDVKYLKQGVHVNAFGSFSPGMRELPNEIFINASLYVDHKESCFSESGDIIEPFSKHIINDNNYKGEIGELINSNIKGRSNTLQRTIFKSVGIATQDLTIAQYIYNKSIKEQFGINIQM